MRHTLLSIAIASTIAASLAVPAMAQVVAPPPPAAGAATDAAVAHHDRVVANRAARHGHYRKAAHANAAANTAATNAAVAPHP